MGKSLVIVESPAKAKTINRYLGSEYIVKSSVGHVRDLAPIVLPKKTKDGSAFSVHERLYARMGINPERDWEANYAILESKRKVVKSLIQSAKECDDIYLATDMDREGEAIAWHVMNTLEAGVKKSDTKSRDRYKRVVFNRITRDAIEKAFAKPISLDLNRVNAQQARRFLDRVVGFMLSPLLWKKVARNLSAGRVQSVATRIVVEREAEINAFVADEYWELFLNCLTKDQEQLRLQLKKHNKKAFKPKTKAETDKIKTLLTGLAPYKITDRTDKEGKKRPFPPFITSTLQQAASARLGYGVRKTMMMAQRLYEAGHITYMRTDSPNLSPEAIQDFRGVIEKRYGKKYLPEKPVYYASKSNAQEAHEAIRPTRAEVMKDSPVLNGMLPDALRLYDLIWRYAATSQMNPMRYTATTLMLDIANYELRASGRVVIFDGYTRVLPLHVKKGSEEESQTLPDLKKGDVLNLEKAETSQHFTRPPARYSEATLVKEMEKRGIGRPSTYASVIGTIQDRGYVTMNEKRLHANKIASIVTNRLMENFHDIMDYSFTAQMEQLLDKIANGELKWKEVLNDFYGDFVKKLEKAETDMRPNDPVLIKDVLCPKCARAMAVRTGSTGMFLGCSGYNLAPTDKDRCKITIDLTDENTASTVVGEVEISNDDDEAATTELEQNRLLNSKRCPKCNQIMQAYVLDEKKRLHICTNIPDCSEHELELGTFKVKGGDVSDLKCDRCQSPMELRSGRFGKYFKCTNEEECTNTRKMLASGQPAPPKMPAVPMPELKCKKVNDHYVLRDGSSGLFLASSQFPRTRETRSPLVEELLPYRASIDPKYHYLLDGPKLDDQGNKTEIRYSRKTTEQYLATFIEKKPTGWQAYYHGGKWDITLKSKKSRTPIKKYASAAIKN